MCGTVSARHDCSRNHREGARRKSASRGLRRALLLLSLPLLCFVATTSDAVDILNGVTRTPPFDWGTSSHYGFAPPAGYGHYQVYDSANDTEGNIWLGVDLFVRSDWPWPHARHSVGAQGNLGCLSFQPTRTGTFAMDASLLFSGLAALYVPCGPDFWGGADAKMTITFQLVVNDLTSGFPLLVDSQNFVIYDAYSQHTSAAPTYWLDESRDYTMSGFTLYSGNSYEAIVKVFVDGRVTVTGGTCGGQTLAVFSFRQGSIGPHNYNMSGYVHVNSMTIRDLNPDETHPTTILYPSGFEVICPGFPFTLLASDPPGGFGMGTTYWRHDGGPTNVFTSGSSISPPYSGLLEYWSVDRAGNEELPHNSQYIEVRAAPSIPMHVSVGDGAAGLWQPVDLVWGAVAGADLYHLQVDDDPQFGSPVLDVLKSETVEHCTGLATSTTHYWRVRSRHGICPDLWSDWSTPWSFTTDVTTAVDETIPSAYRLAQNNPNPFNPKTAIAFDLPRDEFVTLEIYGADGRRVKTLLSGPVVAGRNEVSWNGTDDDGRAVASGVYFYRIEAGEFHDQSKMTLVR